MELVPLQAELRQALEAGLDPPHAVVAGALCGNLLECWPTLWTFDAVDGVEPTNGTQSDGGSRFVERLLTVAATGKQQGRGLLDFLVATITAACLGLPPPSLVPVASG